MPNLAIDSREAASFCLFHPVKVTVTEIENGRVIGYKQNSAKEPFDVRSDAGHFEVPFGPVLFRFWISDFDLV